VSSGSRPPGRSSSAKRSPPSSRSSSRAAPATPTILRARRAARSSGSAAAVADGMVPVALGYSDRRLDDPAGSLLRPSSATSPRSTRFPGAGMKPLAPSLDTIGVIAATVDDIRPRLGGPCGESPAAAQVPDHPGFALCRTPYRRRPKPQTLERLAMVARTAGRRRGHVRELELPAPFSELNDLHRVIMAHETAARDGPTNGGRRGSG